MKPLQNTQWMLQYGIALQLSETTLPTLGLHRYTGFFSLAWKSVDYKSSVNTGHVESASRGLEGPASLPALCSR